MLISASGRPFDPRRQIAELTIPRAGSAATAVAFLYDTRLKFLVNGEGGFDKLGHHSRCRNIDKRLSVEVGLNR